MLSTLSTITVPPIPIDEPVEPPVNFQSLLTSPAALNCTTLFAALTMTLPALTLELSILAIVLFITSETTTEAASPIPVGLEEVDCAQLLKKPASPAIPIPPEFLKSNITFLISNITSLAGFIRSCISNLKSQSEEASKPNIVEPVSLNKSSISPAV